AGRAFVGASACHSVRVAALDARRGRTGALVTAGCRPARPSLRAVRGAVRVGGRRGGAPLCAVRAAFASTLRHGQRAEERANERAVHAGKLGTGALARLAWRLQQAARLAALRSGGRLE